MPKQAVLELHRASNGATVSVQRNSVRWIQSGTSTVLELVAQTMLEVTESYVDVVSRMAPVTLAEFHKAKSDGSAGLPLSVNVEQVSYVQGYAMGTPPVATTYIDLGGNGPEVSEDYADVVAALGG